MQVIIEKGSEEHQLIIDWIHFRQEWHDPEPDSDEKWWEDYHAAECRLVDGFRNTPYYHLAIGLVNANSRQLESMSEKKRKRT